MNADQDPRATFRRCVVTARGQAVVMDEPRPPLGRDDVRIQTAYTLISPGTELALFNGTHIGFSDPSHPFAKYPFRPGYAAVGRATEVGADVTRFAPGDQLYCAGGHGSENTVPESEFTLTALPQGLDPRLALFARLAQIAYTALHVAGDVADQTVAVVGLGLVGNLAAQLFQRAGARVFAFDTMAARCDWAKRCGIEHAFAVDGNLAAHAAGAMGELRPTIVVEATGNAALVPVCLGLVAEQGTVLLLGSPRTTVELDVYRLIHHSGARLAGAHERVIPDVAQDGLDKREVTRRMLAAIAKGELIVEPLISRIVGPDQLGASYRALDQEKDKVIGVLLDWGQDQR
jgi:2-desacetyl-2-hydroxyethyl bacteriochlorophyllide A dehydrogenase